jgi:Leucine-rich repeat (LRR) protein
MIPVSESLRSIYVTGEDSKILFVSGSEHSTRLNYLGLMDCQIDGTELDIRKLQLDSLDLYFNSIETVDFDRLPLRIRFLDLSHNPVLAWKGDPNALKKLEELVLWDNSFTLLPKQLYRHGSLKRMEIQWNTHFDLGLAVAQGQLPRHLEELRVYFEDAQTDYRFLHFEGLDDLQELSFTGATPSDLSGVKDLPDLKRIRFPSGDFESFKKTLSTIVVGHRLEIWMPYYEKNLNENFRQFDFHSTEN